jgi:LemA protein
VSIALVILIAAVVLIAAFVGFTYNRMVAKRQATENSWSQIDVALRRRHDLIPTLVESVKGYASHERGTFESVTQARSTAVADAAQAPPQRAAAEDTLKRATDRLLVVAEAYPELEASKNFSQLADDLRTTEDQIQITRRVYNDTVETYNTLVQVFPAVIVAKLFGFQRREFFDAPAGSEAAPAVDLSAAAPPPAAPGPA